MYGPDGSIPAFPATFENIPAPLPVEPGKKIYPGELGKALDLLAKGKDIKYEGATGVEFTDVGEAFGSFLEKEVKGGKFKTKKQI